MSGIQPVAVYALQVPPGDILVPAVPDFAAMFRVSMAAIDPSAEPEYEDINEKKTPRATLKIVRVPDDMFDDEDSEDEEDEEEALLNGINGADSGDDDDDEDEEEDSGGPSDLAKVKAKKSKLSLAKAIAEADAEEEDDDEEMSEDDAKAAAALSKIMKGKGKASENDDEDDDLDDLDESLEMDETVVCTLDPEKHYQQTLDIVVGEDEKIFFKVSGNFTIHLTGNYVIPMDDGQAQLYDEEEDDEYDLSPDEDELDMLEEGESESDELDDLEDPRVMEVDSDEGQSEAPKLVNDTAGKGKNKRPAPPSDEEEPNLDDLMEKSLKAPELASALTDEGPKKLTKAEKKRLKKMKMMDGEAATTSTANTAPASKPAEPVKKENSVNGEKKVQFAKNLEQGPTPSATSSPANKSDNKKADAKDSKTSLGVKNVNGVTVDDRKLGTGPAATKGNKVGMRYIGKLEDGKVFDANKKGKPFIFKLGSGEVIKGWDIGVAGMSVGGERRITVPAHLGYGSKGAPPDIPPNSTLIFDLKVLTIT